MRAKLQAILLEAGNKSAQFGYLLTVPAYNIGVLGALTFCLVFPWVLWAVEANLNETAVSCCEKIKYFLLYVTFSGPMFLPDKFEVDHAYRT